jgi:LacI family transcriptional regulator
MVNLKDVAEKTGFSISVVSRALNHRPDKHSCVSKRTKSLITKTARELGFRRNRFAESIKRGKAPTIGVFLPNIPNRLIADLIFGIAEEAARQDFLLSFYFSKTLAGYKNFISSTADIPHSGIITYPYFSLGLKITKEIELFQKKGGNILLLNASVPAKDVPVVAIDDYYGGKYAAKHLIERNCKKFVNVNGYPQRTQGFVDTIQKKGKVVKIIGNNEREISSMLKLCCRNKQNFPIGIFATTDNTALTVMRIVRELSLAYGRDILLIGYDDLFLTDEMNPPLTTIHQPFRDEGRTAVRKIVNMINGKQEFSVVIKPRLIIRKTA